MSRIGRAPIAVPPGVSIKLEEGNRVTVKGPKGELSRALPAGIEVSVEANTVHVKRPNDEKSFKSLHGLCRTLVNNMVEGVTHGFSKTLEVNGVGYRAVKEGKKLQLNVGYSHQVTVEETDDISIDVPAPNQIVIKGIDKQKVGQFAADVRKLRPPEPYKGKGIRYAGEHVRRKEGKTGAK